MGGEKRTGSIIIHILLCINLSIGFGIGFSSQCQGFFYCRHGVMPIMRVWRRKSKSEQTQKTGRAAALPAVFYVQAFSENTLRITSSAPIISTMATGRAMKALGTKPAIR